MTSYHVGVDIGGTFTDIVLLGSDGTLHTKKISSSVDDYARAIVEGLVEVFREQGLSGKDIEEIRHGTTVASNAILEHKGARTGLITTKGFRDVLEIRTLRMPRLYDMTWNKPVPLVERYLRQVVDERVDAFGKIERALDRGDAERAVDALLAEKVEAIAVCLLNSFTNPAHELMIRDVIKARAPGLPYSISYEVLPEIKEYERTSTTVVNAYVKPVVATYLRALRKGLDAAGIDARLLLMQSNGGLTTDGAAAERPMNIIESGPAGGVVGAQALARAKNLPRIITFDMGGTTAKASMVEDGEVTRAAEYSVGAGIMIGSRLLTGAGYTLKVPAIDLAEVGAGGGSHVWIDGGGSLQIGPESAGSTPGPVCYGKGGEIPTVTDANVLLGYINPQHLVGGAVKLDAARARASFQAKVATPLAMSLEQAAYGAHQIAASNMIRAIKSVSTERGRDPRGFALFAFGGNGPLTGVEIARALQIRRLLIPPAPGVFSALGLLFSDTEHETVRTLMLRGAEVTPHALESSFAAIEAEATASLVATDGATVTVVRYADVRYAGQAYELPVQVAAGTVNIDRLTADFVAEHIRTYGHGSADDPIDVVSVRALARIERTTSRKYDPVAAIRALPPLETVRRAYFGPGVGRIETPVCNRAGLLAGERRGPLLIDEIDSTCVVPPGCVARLDAYGNIEVEIDG